MKILFDHQIFEAQKFGGISRYFCEVIDGLDKATNADVAVTVKYAQNEYLKSIRFGSQLKSDPGSYDSFMVGREFRGKWNLYAARNKLFKPIDAAAENKEASIKALRRQDFDIFHPTYYDDYFLPYLGDKKFVLTVYDMIHELYPEYFNLADRTAQRKRSLAEKADRIIAISECTKKDLVAICGIAPEKIEVIHLASSLDTHPDPVRVPELPERYVLFVGSRTAYKNFFFFINGMRFLLAADPTLHIVCTGGTFNRHEAAFLEIHGLTQRVHHHSASDAVLKMLYQQAQAFVFPSLYEGFGLPVLEAFGNGCPAVLASAGSLPEIGGDGALYFEPKDAKSLHKAMSTALYDAQHRGELVARGKARLARFSWQKAVHETDALYRTLID